ncbi:MAG: hypothetical protein AAF687_09890 [Pseudomonadota bacterium]
MRTFLFAGAAAMALTGCFAAPEPIEIPQDWDDAAQTCFVVQSLSMREANGRGATESITLDEFSSTMQYILIAASKGDELDFEAAMDTLDISDALVEELGAKDYNGAVANCEKKFGIGGPDDKPELPENEQDAILSCYAMASFFKGTLEEDEAEFGDKAKDIEAVFDRLEDKVETDTDLAAKLLSGDPEQMVEDGAKQAFGEGNPKDYLEACEARFPEE